MKLTRILTVIMAVVGLLIFARPATAQPNNRGGSGVARGDFHRGGNWNRGFWRGGRFFPGWGGANFYFGGFGYPYYGYPYGPYYYGYYGYPYGYPAGPYYNYDPRGVYEGRVANPGRSTNDGGGKDVSMTTRVQRQLARAGYYRGSIDGIMGDGTRRAIRNYERDNGLRVDGQIDQQLLSTMGQG